MKREGGELNRECTKLDREAGEMNRECTKPNLKMPLINHSLFDRFFLIVINFKIA
ncbi:hypothetical protein [Oceanobacillus picturae]|uniref:hypothetical protein n=1 Tax=Oceanobacillus picturae TaxID=171693 RepID=UPI0036D2CB02